MLAGQQPQQAVLQRVGVLVLVDLHVAPAPVVAGEDVGAALEQRDGERDEVVEVQRVGPLELGVDLPPHRDDHLLDVVVQDEPAELVRRGGGEPLAGDDVALGARDRGQHLVAVDAGLVGAREVAVQHALLVALVVDRVARRAPGVAGVRAQDPRAQRVEGAERDGGGEVGADAAREALAHLAGGLVGERDRQDLAGVRDAALDEVRGALGHDARLAGAGAGDDEQRAVGAQHGLALLGIQRAVRAVAAERSACRWLRARGRAARRSRRAPLRRAAAGHAGPFGRGNGSRRARWPGASVCGRPVGLGPGAGRGRPRSACRRAGHARGSGAQRPGIGMRRRRSSSARAARNASPRRSAPHGPPMSSDARSKIAPAAVASEAEPARVGRLADPQARARVVVVGQRASRLPVAVGLGDAAQLGEVLPRRPAVDGVVDRRLAAATAPSAAADPFRGARVVGRRVGQLADEVAHVVGARGQVGVDDLAVAAALVVARPGSRMNRLRSYEA